MNTLGATISVSIKIDQTLGAGPNRVTDASAPYKPADAVTNYNSSTNSGTGANGALRYFERSGSLVATTIDFDLFTEACSDGTAGLDHVRDGWIWNDSATDILTFGLGSFPITSLFFGGTSVTVAIQPGGCWRIPPKPLGANGYVIDSTHRTVRLDSGSATILYRIVFIGD